MNDEKRIAAMITIQEEINLSTDMHEDIVLLYESDGHSERITFMGVNLWDNEDNDRRWHEDNAGYEELEICLRRRLKRIIGVISKINQPAPPD